MTDDRPTQSAAPATPPSGDGADDARREAAAREAAEAALAANRSIERVVLTCLARGEAPVVAVVRR